MQTTIIGAGPTGMFLAISLARRGHQVTIIDRDPGPATDEWWDRKGVMQFHHPHGFRSQSVDALKAEMPDVYDELLGLGAEPAILPDQPDVNFGLRSRRMTFDRALHSVLVREPRVQLTIGHADEIVVDGRRVHGVRINGAVQPARLVIDATGRSGRLSERFRGPADGGDTGISYVSRQYALLDGAEWVR